MQTATLIAFALNLVAAVINTSLGIKGKSSFNAYLAMFNWFLTGAFLTALAQEAGF
ncbi:hypothetical protein [Staphylococcus haemolyticus]|uniref:Uncharacterized protein n=1 Tax=Cronobacter phage vB_CsaM_GAP31 TaxID=1141135 RepID=K4F969_9CAUD|nr:hypothetical protein [Staphylococcus haemolyticus]YP_006986925.1 hypothetical protein GAP31_091 [Cronobacter phage vB_CsaM_GAP31]AFC21270.1 hypothetical protein GAP31_091 [Cronobacter phage vB_CsaM_GAP31]MCC3722278.1 hypothetical protein [Staphylococcus haemolyticus]